MKSLSRDVVPIAEMVSWNTLYQQHGTELRRKGETMTDFKHTAGSAQEEARPVLEGVQKGLGFVPNLIAYMADAPALAQGL